MDKNNDIAEALAALNAFNSAARPFTKLADKIPALEKAVALVAGAEASVIDAEKRKAKIEKEAEELVKAHEALAKEHADLTKTYQGKAKIHDEQLAAAVKEMGDSHRAELVRLHKVFEEDKAKIKEHDLAYFAKLDAERDQRKTKADEEAKALAGEIDALRKHQFELTEEVTQLTRLRDQIKAAVSKGAA